jgi:hypothetical protein
MGPLVIVAGLLALFGGGALLFVSKLYAIDARTLKECRDRDEAARAAQLGDAK